MSLALDRESDRIYLATWMLCQTIWRESDTMSDYLDYESGIRKGVRHYVSLEGYYFWLMRSCPNLIDFKLGNISDMKGPQVIYCYIQVRHGASYYPRQKIMSNRRHSIWHRPLHCARLARYHVYIQKSAYCDVWHLVYIQADGGYD